MEEQEYLKLLSVIDAIHFDEEKNNAEETLFLLWWTFLVVQLQIAFGHWTYWLH
ncbi:hypothetical protein KFK09_024234 [Dendrobium nobile]|uniref:Uncharacterized protein n=1 Tax=Dendrobium nobile TaxID=94219 RepID=A0A8T3ADH6_DENNO|nr:hypothetical protein KFK09_024234 [Dendrobium nobile]